MEILPHAKFFFHNKLKGGGAFLRYPKEITVSAPDFMNKEKEIIKKEITKNQITKIVYLCALKDSYIVEHLQKQDNYLLKLCHDPDNINKIVDNTHPDVILIDCGTKIFYESETACESELKEIIELHNPQMHPALILTPDYLPDRLPIWDIAHKAQIIIIFDSDPGTQVKIKCFENRCDVIVSPFSFEELNFKITLHANQKELHQRVSWQKAALKRAVEHIDKLKQIIFGIRKEFLQEKDILLNSLKQINLMSSERDDLGKRLDSARVKLSENIKGINDFLCSMVESRNEFQKGHSKRVAEIAVFVANKIGVEAKSIEILKNAAMLHEVGMLLIPSSILNKDPSKLSEYENNMMLLHPSKGAAYLEKCPGFKKVAGIIRHLHENSDGTGAPEGLNKRYIPMLSKVLAGADVLDQIWIDNPNSSIDRLLEILEDYAGSRLDPSIVNFLEKYIVTVLNNQIIYQINSKINDNTTNEQIDSSIDTQIDSSINTQIDTYNNLNNHYVRLKEIGVHQLKPGMVTGAGFFTKTGTKLFSHGTTLTEDSIRMLEQYNKEYPVDETIFVRCSG